MRRKTTWTAIVVFIVFASMYTSGEEETTHAAGEAEPAAGAESDEAWPRWDMEMSDGDEVALARDGAVVFVRPDGKWQYLIPCEETIASAGADRSHALWRYPPVAGRLVEEARPALPFGEPRQGQSRQP